MAYLLTVSRMDFGTRKKRWADPSYRSTVRIIGAPEFPIAYPGLLLLIDDAGDICASVPLAGPKGMLQTEVGLLVGCFAEIRSFSADLVSSHTFVSEPWCNDLHSLRPSPNGLLVAVAGVDAAFEISLGGTVMWEWWATDHGFSVNLQGEPWSLGKDGDHRRFSYPLELQSTHVNAIAAVDNVTFVATLLHTNTLVAIDRDSGDCSPVLEDLRRPHAVRAVGDGLITLTDTEAGEAILAHVHDGRAEVVKRLSADTSWLHDAYFDGERWMFVDGANSRIVHADAEGAVQQIDAFDSEWCLYEVLPLNTLADFSQLGGAQVSG